MFVFENNSFTERQDLDDIYEELHSSEDDLSNALGAVGYEKRSQYYHKDDTAGMMGIEVNSRISEDRSSLSKEYEFLVDWYLNGDWTGVLIKNTLDMQDFLAKYLPVVKLAGDLLDEGI